MINIKKLTENLTQMRSSALFEDTFRNIASGVDNGRKLRANSLPTYFQYVDQSKDGTARSIWETPSETNRSKRYQQVVEIKVPIEGGLFAVAGGKWKPKEFSQALAKADVRVHCTCPDFYWSGMKYNLGPGGPHKGSLAHDQSSEVTEETTPIKPPDIRDPERKNVMCKHLYAVWQVFPTNSFSIMKSAFDYAKGNELTPVDEKITRDSDDGKATLEKDIDGISVTEGDAESVRDALIQGAEELHAAQETGSEELMDERNDEVVDTTEDEMQSQGAEELIDDENQEVPELITDEVEEVKAQGAEDIIDEKNEVVKEEEAELDVNAILPERNGEDIPDEDIDDDEYSANDILAR